MYTVMYRYRVPADAEAAYVALQRRVGELYRGAGCLRYVVLKPREGGGEWLDLSWFESREAFQRAEEQIEREGRLGPLFDEFLRITRQRQEDIRVSEWDEAVALEGGPKP